MAFSSKYQAQIDDLYNQLANRKFSYDYSTDPLYQQYASQYTKNGKKAMEDTYGMVAARTGGLGSSYADVAAQNAYGQYMSDLAAKIPELEEIARSNFNSETDRLNSNLSNLMSLRDDEYTVYQNELAAQQAAAAAAAAKSASSSSSSGSNTTAAAAAPAAKTTSYTYTGSSGAPLSNNALKTWKANNAASSAATKQMLSGTGLQLAANSGKTVSSPFGVTYNFSSKKKK